MQSTKTNIRRWTILTAAVAGCGLGLLLIRNAEPTDARATATTAAPSADDTLASFALLAPVPELLTGVDAIDITESDATQKVSVPVPAMSGANFVRGLAQDGKLTVLANRAAVLTTDRPYSRISVGQPEIADVNAIGEDTLLVTAIAPGNTQLIVWDDAGERQMIEVAVQFDLATLQQQLDRLLPGSNVQVTALNGVIALKGSVPNLQAAEQAVAIAQPFGEVLNLTEVAGGHQVMLQVTFAEVSRSATKQLGVNFGYSDGDSIGGSNIGQVSPLNFFTNDDDVITGLGIPDPSAAVTLFGLGQVGNTTIAGFLSALRENNLLRVLAEPNLIAMSGEEASFLAGGDFPVPVVQEGSTGSAAVTVEYREFGVKLNFTPVVLGDGKIRLKVSPEVSDVDFTNAVRANGFLIPGRRTRRLTTTIELVEGQTFAVAGLLDNRVVASRDATPLLGDLPVLGTLFRSVRYQRQETELVVLVTPRLVSAMNPSERPTVPGEFWQHPNEAELYLKGELGGPLPTKPTVPATPHAAPASTLPAAKGSPAMPSRGPASPEAPLFIGRAGFVPQEPEAQTAAVE
ncbi:MAG: type II and III secretion system protein family protein [Phycisphaerae bacterium]